MQTHMTTLAARGTFWAAALFIVTASTLNAQSPCFDSTGLANKGTLDANGIRTIRVNVPTVGTGDGQVNQGTHDAILNALNDWNAQTATTKINFFPQASGGDISIFRDSAFVASKNSVCGYGEAGGNAYIDDYINGLGANPTANHANGMTNAAVVKWAVTHELAHVLNLHDTTNAGSITDNLGDNLNDCEDGVTNHMPSTRTIQSGDATHAKDCANKLDQVQYGGGAGQSQPSGNCWDIYWVTWWYELNDQDEWEYVESYWTYLYTTCDQPPF